MKNNKKDNTTSSSSVASRNLWLVFISTIMSLVLILTYIFYNQEVNTEDVYRNILVLEKAKEWSPNMPNLSNNNKSDGDHPKLPLRPLEKPQKKKEVNRMPISLFISEWQGNIAYFFKDYVSALYYYKKSLKIAFTLLDQNSSINQEKITALLKKCNDIYNQADVLLEKGQQKESQQNYQKAVDYYQQSLVITKAALKKKNITSAETTHYQETREYLLTQIYSIYSYRLSNYSQTLPFLTELLNIYDVDEEKRVNILLVMAFCYGKLEKYSEEQKLYTEAIAIYKKLKTSAPQDEKEIYDIEILKNLIYQAHCYKNLKQENKAIQLYYQCDKMFIALNNQRTFADLENRSKIIILKDMANIYYYYLKGCQQVKYIVGILSNMHEKNKNIYQFQEKAQFMFMKGRVEKELREHRAAIDSFESSIKEYNVILKNSSQQNHKIIYKNSIASAFKQQADCYKGLKNYDEAFAGYEKAVKYKSQVYSAYPKGFIAYVEGFISTLSHIEHTSQATQKSIQYVLRYTERHLGKNHQLVGQLENFLVIKDNKNQGESGGNSL